MMDYRNIPDPPESHYRGIIFRIGHATMQKIKKGMFPVVSSEADLEKEISLFFKKANLAIEYEVKHPLLKEVPDSVHALLEQEMQHNVRAPIGI